jgi:hypothetical protein
MARDCGNMGATRSFLGETPMSKPRISYVDPATER